MCPAPSQPMQPASSGTLRLCRPRARRYPFVAVADLTNLQSDENIRRPTSDLSLFGCHIIAVKPYSVGTRVRLRMVHEGATFQALGKVVRSQPGVGMGIEFSALERKDQQTLEEWIDKLRNTKH